MLPSDTKIRGRIPMHRSIRHVSFNRTRFLLVVTAAMVFSALLYWKIDALISLYGGLEEWILRLGGVPFQRVSGDFLGHIPIPVWSVATFNPVASHGAALCYIFATLFIMFITWRCHCIPTPVGAWLGVISLVLLLATLILHWKTDPLLTPEAFTGLWGKITLGTALIYPCLWAFLLGILPLNLWRTLFWFLMALIFFFVWSTLRMAFFLALAHWAGVIWLPIGIIFGGTIPDCLVLIVAFGFVMERAGESWEQPA